MQTWPPESVETTEKLRAPGASLPELDRREGIGEAKGGNLPTRRLIQKRLRFTVHFGRHAVESDEWRIQADRIEAGRKERIRRLAKADLRRRSPA